MFVSKAAALEERRHAGMAEGRVADHGDRRMDAGLGRALGHADARAHADAGVDRVVGREIAERVAADVAEDVRPLVPFQGLVQGLERIGVGAARRRAGAAGRPGGIPGGLPLERLQAQGRADDLGRKLARPAEGGRSACRSASFRGCRRAP